MPCCVNSEAAVAEVIVGDQAEVAWRKSADLEELMPYGVFEPVVQRLQCVCPIS
jgi:hypothetical protein